MQDQFFSREDPDQPLSKMALYFLLVIKTQFHFSWMYMSVYMFTVSPHMQYYRRILVGKNLLYASSMALEMILFLACLPLT